MATRATHATRGTPVAAELPARFKTIACLGENPAATTYWAKRTDDGLHVVVKVPGPDLLEEASFAYQLERAALELLRVRHPHIVRVLDAGRADGTPYVVAEHVKGENLTQVLVGGTRTQNPTQIHAWLLDVAEALDFIHAKKIVHGEVRPTHILCEGRDLWRITDFAFAAARCGLAREAQEKLASRAQGFTAPEVMAGGAPTPASDQWALAACVALALAGQTPEDDLRPLETVLEERVSAEATEDLLKALSSDPARRFPSCYEFARAFGLERKRVRRTSGLATSPASPGGAAAEPFHDATYPRALSPTGRPPMNELSFSDGSTGPATDLPAFEHCWRLRMGPGDRYARVGRDAGFVAAGWEELGDLKDFAAADGNSDLSDLVAHYERTFGLSGAPARVGAAQVWRFLCEMQEGDLVLVPDLKESVLHVGLVDGPYEWKSPAGDGCRLPRRRAVRWIEDVRLEDVPNAIARRLDSAEDLANLDHHRKYVRELLRAPGSATGPGREAVLLKRIVASLYQLELEVFPEFLRGLFSTLRYDAEILPGRSDESWEALGRVSAQGLAEVVLRVVAQRSRRDLDVDAVFAARGALATDEQGAILSLGGFTPRARAEASAVGKKAIRLIDGPTLAALALERWDDLPPKVQDAMGVKQVQRTTVEVHFEATS